MNELERLRNENAELLNELEIIEATTNDNNVAEKIRKFMYEHNYWVKYEAS